MAQALEAPQGIQQQVGDTTCVTATSSYKPKAGKKTSLPANEVPVVVKLADALYGPILKVQVDHHWIVLKQVDLDLARATLRLQGQAADNPFQENRAIQRILDAGGHPNVVRYYHTRIENQERTMLIPMEYCPEGDLWNYLNQWVASSSTSATKLQVSPQPDEHQHHLLQETEESPEQHQHQLVGRNQIVIHEKLALRLLAQITDALEFLHRHDIAHRDLSLENVLINANSHCKLMDFGLSVPATSVCCGRVGKAYYMAPEVVAGQRYDPRRADVWSLGIVFFMLLTGSPLCELAEPTCAAVQLVSQRGGLEKLLEHWRIRLSYASLNLISCMLQVDPAKRATPSEILRHPALEWAKQAATTMAAGADPVLNKTC